MMASANIFTQRIFVKNSLGIQIVKYVIVQSDIQKQCKWTNTTDGCRRGLTCESVHEHEMCPCEGCKDVRTNLNCVKEHIVTGRKCYVCLNCDEWIRDKAKVFYEQGN